ncbi:MAG TPA: uridylate kinase [Clostridia bacterium]|mgnify:CR=1 FL=1|nr:uridylate kinase [Clostridia bacterium]
MSAFDVELVGKIGSMALIRKEDNDIDYNIFSRLGAQLRPGIIWISSGATEIGRLDYMKRNNGLELSGAIDDIKTDYAAQGQSILMENYRRFINPKYSIRQVLVEHYHFNDEEKRKNIRNLLLRAVKQGAIPIINYNDPVSVAEIRKMELRDLKSQRERVVECVDNDETAAVVAELVKAKLLVILTSVDGIYKDPANKDTLIKEITGSTIDELIENVNQAQKGCCGASRAWSNGAWAKLEYIKTPLRNGTKVIIGNAAYKLSELIEGTVNRTVIGIR